MNREQDYERKRFEYAEIALPEYWLIDPEWQTITVLQLAKTAYQEVGVFQGQEYIFSPEFGPLPITAEQILGE